MTGAGRRRGLRRLALSGVAALIVSASAMAHGGHDHGAKAPRQTSAPAAAPAPPAASAIPIPVGVDFALVDQSGRPRRLADFAGRHVLLFFGYANCDSICSAAIPAMMATLDALGPARQGIDAVMITVDPERDTPEGMRRGLAKYGADVIGLTGDQAELARVWRGFHVSVSTIGQDPTGSPIIAHGSLVYLLGPDGAVQTFLPPVLDPARMARIVSTYVN